MQLLHYTSLLAALVWYLSHRYSRSRLPVGIGVPSAAPCLREPPHASALWADPTPGSATRLIALCFGRSLPRGWPEEYRALSDAGARTPWRQKRPVLFWRGALTNPLRQVNRTRLPPRGPPRPDTVGTARSATLLPRNTPPPQKRGGRSRGRASRTHAADALPSNRPTRSTCPVDASRCRRG